MKVEERKERKQCMSTRVADASFDADEFQKEADKCRRFGIELLRPRGLRKYFRLEGHGQRVRLSKTWGQSKTRIASGVQWLYEELG
jgi:hypothetical protein